MLSRQSPRQTNLKLDSVMVCPSHSASFVRVAARTRFEPEPKRFRPQGWGFSSLKDLLLRCVRSVWASVVVVYIRRRLKKKTAVVGCSFYLVQFLMSFVPWAYSQSIGRSDMPRLIWSWVTMGIYWCFNDKIRRLILVVAWSIFLDYAHRNGYHQAFTVLADVCSHQWLGLGWCREARATNIPAWSLCSAGDEAFALLSVLLQRLIY